MAYGVKYRLEFSDLLGNGKKVEILQDGYLGDVLPMIGTGDPVQIEWEGDDDFYQPIIGSSCTINLLVTDDVSYDDFFKGAEEEYRVQVYYDRTLGNAFQDRVEEFDTDAGVCEAPECIDEIFSNDATRDWKIFWEGFLYLDTYSEVLSTTPYEISITALDGLGLLDVNDSRAFNIYVNPLESGANLGEWYYVSEMLQEFNKDATAVERYLYWAGDIQWTGTSDFIGDVPARPWSTYSNIDDKLNFLNNKEVLENILRKSNSRIFHAFGDWWVVPNSLYLDDVFSGQYYDRSVFKNALGNGQNEIIDFQVFSVGNGRTFVGNAKKNVTKRIVSDLQPIENDMTIEYLSPLKKVIVESDLKQEGEVYGLMSSGSGFTFGSSGYVLTYGAVATNHDFVGSNNQSYKLTNFTTSSGSRITAISQNGFFKIGNYQPADNVQYSFEYLFDSSATSVSFKLYYSVKVQSALAASLPITTRYYDKDNNSMSSSLVYNEVQFSDVRELGRWQKESGNLPDDALLGSYMNISVTFYQPVLTSGTGYSAMYLDNIIAKDSDTERDEQTLTSTIAENRGVYDFEVVPNEEIVNAFLAKGVFSSLIPVDDDRNNAQQILNDYRTYVPRYEGTGYGQRSKPLTPLNKLYVNFDSYKDDESSMIDTLKYNLRRNTFEFIAHTPNNDPDVTVTHQLKQN